MKTLLPIAAALLLISCGQNQGAPSKRDDAKEPSIAEEIVTSVSANEDASIAFLEKVVNLNSGTMNFDGVKAVGDVFDEEFAALGFETEWVDQSEVNRAGHLLATREGDKGLKILLIGHLDTVFRLDSATQTLERIDEEVTGPGVNDMKGGDVTILYALKALNEIGALDGAQIRIILTGDEEKPGKPFSISRQHLIEAAQWADVALNFEGGEKGAAVSSRRSSSQWRLTVTGRRSHSSRIFSDDVGAGAIFEAARILNAFYTDVRGEESLTFNPGAILGGTVVRYDPDGNNGSAFGKTNVVSQRVEVHGGIRTISQEQLEATREKMRVIVEDHLPHTDAEITFEDGYPPMTPTANNQKLLDIYSKVSEDLGYGPLAPNDPNARGAADISFAAPYVKASIDGLGVYGDGAHTPEEKMELPSLEDATARAALFLYRLIHEEAPAFE